MIDMTNCERRYIITPDGKGEMFGYDGHETATVHFAPDDKGTGENKCYQVSECEEVIE